MTKAGENFGFAAQIHPRLGQLPQHPHLPRTFQISTHELNIPLPTPPALVEVVGMGRVSNGPVGTMKTAGPAIRALLPIIWTMLSTMAAWPVLWKRQI